MSKELLLNRFTQSLESGSCVKLTLSRYEGSEQGLTGIVIRPVELKGVLLLSFLYRSGRTTPTKNFPLEEGVEQLRTLLARDFSEANLFTTEGNFLWQRGKERLKKLRPTHSAVDLSHDRPKRHPVSAESARWMEPLGLLKSGMGDKFRQVQKFVELLESIIPPEEVAARSTFRTADMGCGKGYLTFAAHHFLTTHASGSVETQGIELRQALVDGSNQIAKECQMEGLIFEAGEIGQSTLGPLDLLIALHACDTATDDAIYAGIRAGAEWIVVSPCCHKEVRPQLKPEGAVAELTRFGIFAERMAEMVTDGARALLLEREGFRTRVVEFVSAEHTARNVMIVARRDSGVDRSEAARRLSELKRAFGVRELHLERLLG